MTANNKDPIIKVSNLTPKMTGKVKILQEGEKVKNKPLTEQERKIRKHHATTSSGLNKTANLFGTGDISMGAGGNWYSPQLSTDFLEKPQNKRERYSWYRHFYNSTEIVGAAVDIHTNIPLAKIKLEKPKAQNPHLAEYSFKFFEKMTDRLKMLKSLGEAGHEVNLLGNCVTPNSKVRTPYGYLPISEMKPGDRVLTHDGSYQDVEAYIEYENKDILSIAITGKKDKLELTPEHPVEVWRNGKYVFVNACDLVKGDLVKQVTLSRVIDVESVVYVGKGPIALTDTGCSRETVINKKAREREFDVPTSLDIDDDFLYLLGYWLGDGTLGRDSSRPDSWGRDIWYVCFDNKSSVQHKDKITKILSEKLGDTCIRVSSVEGMDYVHVKNNPAFIEWWSENFGNTCLGPNHKRIPDWVKELPKEKVVSLIAGLIDSEACTAHTGLSKKYAVVSSSSETLVRDIWESAIGKGLLAYEGGKSALRLIDTPRSKGAKESYGFRGTVTFMGEETCSTLDKATSKSFKVEGPYRVSEARKYEGYWCFPITSVEEKGKSDVCNLQVSKNHTFVVEGNSTHNCFVYAEDHNPYNGLSEDKKNSLAARGKEQSDMLLKKFSIEDKDPNYIGWTRLTILPPDQVQVDRVPFADQPIIEYHPDNNTREALGRAKHLMENSIDGHRTTQPTIPKEVSHLLNENGAIPLEQNPEVGSFVYHLARKKSQYETYGTSILERCLNTLLIKDKLRQAQTSIASRHMTPIRVVTADELSATDVDDLREQVDMALMDPDYSIIANYQINWDEQGSNQRLLDLSSEFERYDSDLYAGLGVTKEMMTGEASFQGSKITMELLNTQYLQFREMLKEYVERSLFEPVARRKGFIEKDKYGNEEVIYPKLSFARMSIRDNDAVFEQLMQLYQKGSLPIDDVLEFLGIDPVAVDAKLKRDIFTLKDASFNEFLRGFYQTVGSSLPDKTDAGSKLATVMGLTFKEDLTGGGEGGEGGEEGGGDDAGGGLGGLRFASTEKGGNKDVSKLLKIAQDRPDLVGKMVEFLENNDV